MAALCAECHIKLYNVMKDYFDDNEASLKLLHEQEVLPTELLCKLWNLPCTLRNGRWFCSH